MFAINARARALKCYLRIVQMPTQDRRTVRRNNARDFAADSFRTCRTRGRYFKPQSDTHSDAVFIPLSRSAGENSDRQTRRLLIGGRNGGGGDISRVRDLPEDAREGGRGSRFDPRMIIRRQVISGSRYTGGVMGKTVTLLSYPL